MSRWTERSSGARQTLVIAHRGLALRSAENTIGAFVDAIDAGADGVELDVRRCATGEPVVFHDETLLRLAGQKHSLEQLPLSALAKVELLDGGRIPTLDDVFESLGPGPLINVEIKTRAGRGQRETESVVRCINRHGRQNSVLVSSFDPVVLVQLKVSAPRLPTGFLFHGKLALPLRRAWPAALLGTCALHPERRLVDRARLQTWHQRGYRVHVWTVDEPDDIASLSDLGVDGIITNTPAVAAQYAS